MYFDGIIVIEKDDQCYICTYYRQGIACPLLEALITGVAYLDGDVAVRNCGFHVPHMQVVE